MPLKMKVKVKSTLTRLTREPCHKMWTSKIGGLQIQTNGALIMVQKKKHFPSSNGKLPFKAKVTHFLYTAKELKRTRTVASLQQ